MRATTPLDNNTYRDYTITMAKVQKVTRPRMSKLMISFTHGQKAYLDARSKRDGVSIAEIVRYALQTYINMTQRGVDKECQIVPPEILFPEKGR